VSRILSVLVFCLPALAVAQTAVRPDAPARTAPKTVAVSTTAQQSKAAPRPAQARSVKRKVVRRPAIPSEGMRAGLHKVDDPLDLKSSVALVVDQDTDEVLFEKNPDAVLPIASITKLMTAIVTLDAELPLDEQLVVTRYDRTIDRVRSRLTPGVKLTRAQALQLALMASENHAAQLLARTYPGGVPAFVEAMNAKAQMLGMHDTHFADPTGLSPENRSSPGDLVRLVKAAYDHPEIREYSTSAEFTLPVGRRVVRYANTNLLTSRPEWDIGVQKTGYISAAGRCLVMQAAIEGKRVVMVLLDSVGKYSRIGDAQRLRRWIAEQKASPSADARDSKTKPI
jgi:D-alanyl-D-alanine endopeptidase (penicillin-binding protein 7)